MMNKKLPFLLTALLAFLLGGCYTFHDVSIQPPNAKTVHVNYIENKARFINPLLSPQLTDKLRQKINNQTRLTQVQDEGTADFNVSGWITDFSVTTAGISSSQQQAATNRLNVSVHIIFRNKLDEKRNFEADLSRNFDFSANLSLDQAQAQLLPTIIQNMTDEIFNRIFSNW